MLSRATSSLEFLENISRGVCLVLQRARRHHRSMPPANASAPRALGSARNFLQRFLVRARAFSYGCHVPYPSLTCRMSDVFATDYPRSRHGRSNFPVIVLSRFAREKDCGCLRDPFQNKMESRVFLGTSVFGSHNYRFWVKTAGSRSSADCTLTLSSGVSFTGTAVPRELFYRC